MRVKISVRVPPENAEELRTAIARAGAGNIGDYEWCSFTTIGTGRFKPTDNATPHFGVPGKLAEVIEENIEVITMRAHAAAVIDAIRSVHPYEEPGIHIVQLLEEDEL